MLHNAECYLKLLSKTSENKPLYITQVVNLLDKILIVSRPAFDGFHNDINAKYQNANTNAKIANDINAK